MISRLLKFGVCPTRTSVSRQVSPQQLVTALGKAKGKAKSHDMCCLVQQGLTSLSCFEEVPKHCCPLLGASQGRNPSCGYICTVNMGSATIPGGKAVQWQRPSSRPQELGLRTESQQSVAPKALSTVGRMP